MATDEAIEGAQPLPALLASGNPGNPWGPRPGGGPGPERPQGPNGRPENPWNPVPGADLDALIASVRRIFGGGRPPGGKGPRGSGSGGGSGGGGWSFRGRHFNGAQGAALLVLIVIGVWLASGIYVVQPDEQGVIQRFGAFVRTAPPGLNYHLPWPIETVQLPPVTRVEHVAIGYRMPQPTTQGATPIDVPAESLMLTGDENIIDLHFTVFWRIRDAKAFLFNTLDPAQSVKAVAESVMREVIGSTPIQPAMTDARARIQTEVQTAVQKILDRYQAGVEITQVTLQKSDPPAQVIESFLDVQRAAADAQRAVNEADTYANNIVPRAHGQVSRIVATAEAQKTATIAQATGQSQRFLSVLAAYDAAKSITLKRLYIETMQSILSTTPTTVVDSALHGTLPILPLGNALNQAGKPPAPPAAPPKPPATTPTPSTTGSTGSTP